MYNTGTGEAYYNGTTGVKRHSNALSDAEIDRLTKQGGQFSLKLTELDYIRAVCTHRSKDGMRDTLVQDPETGKFRCTLCGYRFDIIEPSTCKMDIEQAVAIVQNYMQSIKVLYIDMPAEASREYMQIIAMLDKLPEFFEIAANNYLKHESSVAGWNYNNRNAGAAQIFNILNSGLAGGSFQTAGMMNTGSPYGEPYPTMGGNTVPVGAVPPGMVAPGMMPGMVMTPGAMGGPQPYQTSTTDYVYKPAGQPNGQDIQTMMRIAYAMADQGSTPEQIASTVGVDVNTVNAWLSARHPSPVAAPAEGATTTTSFQA